MRGRAARVDCTRPGTVAETVVRRAATAFRALRAPPIRGRGATMRVTAVLLVLAASVLAQEREVTECEICGGTVYQTPKSYISGNTKYIYVDDPPHVRYCNRCQRDINTGKIDPDHPPALGPRDDEEMGENPYGNPYAVDKFEWEKRKKPEKDAHTKEAESGMGVVPYVVAVAVAVGLALRYFLRS
jgi:hypothetical protein